MSSNILSSNTLANPNRPLYAGGSSASGVSQLVAGTNITLSPAGGTGVVTINASGGPSGGVSSVTGTANQITATTASNAVTLALAPPSTAPTAGAYANPSSVSVDALGRVTAISAGTVPGSGNLNCDGVNGASTPAQTIQGAMTGGVFVTPNQSLTFDAGATASKAIVTYSYIIFNSSATDQAYKIGLYNGTPSAGTGVSSAIAFVGAGQYQTVVQTGYISAVSGSTTLNSYVSLVTSTTPDPAQTFTNPNIICTWGGS
jgi:hypothetical protein